MRKEVYVIWNTLEDRPLLVNINYGVLSCYLTVEQAQSCLDSLRSTGQANDLEIRKMALTKE